MKKIIGYLGTIILLLYIATFSGKSSQPYGDSKDFDAFLEDIFVQSVQSDTLTLNFSLEAPEKYGIEDIPTTLGEYGIEALEEDIAETEYYLKCLKSFQYKKLNTEQQLIYDILDDYLHQAVKINKFKYYEECLGPETGNQSQLPIVLAEYNFYTKEDIDQYILLLPCVYDYFNDIIKYEQEKSKQGLFMSDAVANSIIEQCREFIKNPEENFLIKRFNEKVSEYNGLSQDEIEKYQNENKEAILNYVIPAYEELIDALTELKGTGTNDYGLYYYPDGKAYYECLVQYETGSDKSIKEITRMLDNAILVNYGEISKSALLDYSIIDQYYAFDSFPITDPPEIIKDLENKISKDFPEVEAVNCNIKYVPESLEEFLSPAMYLVPPIDNYKNNNIYINGDDPETLSKIYTSVAHEGYPGHLYQHVYFRSHTSYPIRALFDFDGYSEGWATYAEMYSYQISDIDKKIADIMKAEDILNICMGSRIDIGIHYEGWTKDDLVDYLSRFHMEEAGDLYDRILTAPGLYLPYAVGYLEIMDLKQTAENELGNAFDLKDFNQFLLDVGPAQFCIIEEKEKLWLEEY
jgi:uncharacterized protein (DUF885 family)